MDTKQLEVILALFEKSTVSEMELESEAFKLKLKRNTEVHEVIARPVLHQTASPSVKEDNAHWVKAPLVGTYYHSANPDAKPYVEVGQVVKEGQVICLIEAMKVMNEIKADRNGVVQEIKAINGKMVEYNQALVRIGDTP